MTNTTELKLRTQDGRLLHGTAYSPQNPNETVVLLNPANAVKESYYTDFAAYLAAQGYWVYTYAYSGFGKNKPDRIHNATTTMSDWIFQDYAAMLQHILQTHPDYAKVVIGHSFGGQIVPLLPQSQHIDLGVMVASQTGAWQTWKGKGRRLMWTLSHLILPINVALWGYVPARFGLGQDVPKGVALEWAKWIKHPEYLFAFLPEARQQYAQFQAPTLVWSFEDDDYAPQEAVEGLLKYLPQDIVQRRYLHPKELDAKSIGHFGFFRKKFEPTLWQTTEHWMRQALAQVNKTHR